MITTEELVAVGIPVSGDGTVAALYAEAAFDWLLEHTTLQFDKADTASLEALPACVKLFVVKYAEVMQRRIGVTSQSIEGMSMTYDASDTTTSSVWALANTLLGAYLKSQVRVTPAKRRW